MASSQAKKLTTLGISKMLEADAEDQDVVVQVYDISTTKNGRVICTISDGHFYTKAYLNDDSVIKPGRDQLSIISIKSHGKMKNNIGVTSLKLITKYSDKLGAPEEWATKKQNLKEISSYPQFILQKIKNQPKTPISVIKKEDKTATKNEPHTSSTNPQDEYTSIDHLYVGLKRWTLLCRLTRKNLKESSKKGIKILEIELVDKSKKKIIGTFFREAAVDFHQYLKQGSIYQISKGQVSEGNYNNSKNSNFSSFSIIFDSKSQFNEVSDVNIIVKSEDSAITLGSLFEKKIFNQQFDVVAYVLEVKPESSINKGDQTIKIKQVVLADPQNQITMSANLWRWSSQFSKEMEGKVLIFSRFILKQYKNSISLHSGIRSSIVSNHGHIMKKYENRKIDTSTFTSTTEKREYVEQDISEFCTSTMELDSKVRYMSSGETIKSVLNLWINRFAYSKKWYYESCPKCRKAAEKYSKCTHCQFAIEDTVISFSMGIEVSDFSGSIWITAYDELGKKIFADLGNTAAKQLTQLSKQDLSELLQNYLYQPLRLKITTKKDQQGRIKHLPGRLYDIHEQKIARQNLNKIEGLMKGNY